MKHFLSIFLLSLVLFSCSNNSSKEGNLTVKGQVKGLRLGTLLIKQMVKDSLVSIDSIKVDGEEHFEFKTHIDEPQMMLLELPEVKDGRILFFAAPNDTIQIFTYVESFGINPKVKGGINQEKLNTFNKMIQQFNNKEMDLFKAKFDASQQHLLTEADSLGKQLERLQRKRQLYVLNFVFQNKEQAIAPYEAMMNFYDNPKALDTIYKVLPENMQNSLYGKEIQKIISE